MQISVFIRRLCVFILNELPLITSHESINHSYDISHRTSLNYQTQTKGYFSWIWYIVVSGLSITEWPWLLMTDLPSCFRWLFQRLEQQSNIACCRWLVRWTALTNVTVSTCALYNSMFIWTLIHVRTTRKRHGMNYCNDIALWLIIIFLDCFMLTDCVHILFSVLYGNQISDLPPGIFKGLTSLQLL